MVGKQFFTVVVIEVEREFVYQNKKLIRAKIFTSKILHVISTHLKSKLFGITSSYGIVITIITVQKFCTKNINWIILKGIIYIWRENPQVSLNTKMNSTPQT